VGYTPDILALVWVGFDNGDPVNLSGALAALPIWADLVSAIPQYVSETWFKAPAGIVQKEICRESGLLAESGCPEKTREYFLTDNAPKDYCNLHGSQNPLKNWFKRIKELGN
jgi:penicillin-binding protein 1B